jgi:hypothetical protein
MPKRSVTKSKRAGWRARLSRPIQVKSGPKLETLSDVRDFILAEPGHVQEGPAWQLAAVALLAAADGRRLIVATRSEHHPHSATRVLANSRKQANLAVSIFLFLIVCVVIFAAGKLAWPWWSSL